MEGRRTANHKIDTSFLQPLQQAKLKDFDLSPVPLAQLLLGG